MAKYVEKIETLSGPSIKYKDELKVAVRRFVVLNVSALLAEGADVETVSEIVSRLIVGYANESLDELVASLSSIAKISKGEVRDA